MKKGLILSIGTIAVVATVMGSNVAFASSDSNKGLPLELQQLENTFNSFKTTVTDDISTLQSTVTNLTEKLSNLQDTASTHTQQINDLNTTVNSQKNTIESLNSTITSQGNEISKLESELNQVQNQLNSIQNTEKSQSSVQQLVKFTTQTNENWYVTPDSTQGYDAKIYFTTTSSNISQFVISPILFQNGNLVTPGAVGGETWGLTGGILNGMLNVPGNSNPFINSIFADLPVNTPLILNVHADTTGSSASITDEGGKQIFSLSAPISNLNYNGYSPSDNYQWGVMIPSEVKVSKVLVGNNSYSLPQ